MQELIENPSANDSEMPAVVKDTSEILRIGLGMEGLGVLVAGGGVGLGVEVVGGGGDSVGGEGSSGSTLVITHRCRPPRSFPTKKTVSTEQSLAALRKRLQPFVERSFKAIRYVPSSPFTGTNRNRFLPSNGSIVATSESVPRHLSKLRAFTGPTHLRTEKIQ